MGEGRLLAAVVEGAVSGVQVSRIGVMSGGVGGVVVVVVRVVVPEGAARWQVVEVVVVVGVVFELRRRDEAHGGGGRRPADAHRRHETFLVGRHFGGAESGFDVARRQHFAAAAADAAALQMAGAAEVRRRAAHGRVEHDADADAVAGRCPAVLAVKQITIIAPLVPLNNFSLIKLK